MVENKKYTNEGLPVVSKATLEALLDLNVQRGSSFDRALDVLSKLEDENPNLFNYFVGLAGELTKNESHRQYFEGIVQGFYIAYVSLRNQASSNKLSPDSN